MRGPRQATNLWSTQPAWSRRGRRTGRMITRVPPGTWETLTVPRRRPDGSNRYNKLPADPSASASGAERGRMADAPRYRQAKETKCGETTVRESQRPIVAANQGNGPSRTLGSEGGTVLWAGRWNHTEDSGPRLCVTLKPPDRVRDSEATTRRAVCGISARTDLWEPWGSNPPRRPGDFEQD